MYLLGLVIHRLSLYPSLVCSHIITQQKIAPDVHYDAEQS